MAPDIVIVGKYQYDYEGDAARASLEAAGIECVILNSSGSVLPSLQMLSPVRLAVSAADADLAREILASPAPPAADPPPEDV